MTQAENPRTPPPVPAISGRDTPRFGARDRREELAAAFADQGPGYDRLRPGYPAAILEAIMSALPQHGAAGGVAVDLGAGTGKLSRGLAEAGLDVIAVDPSRAMLDQLGVPSWEPGRRDGYDGIAAHDGPDAVVAGRTRTHQGTAEATGLPDRCCDLVTAAQAWHWFDVDRACAEIQRILRPGGVLALVWNTMDVTVPWVHRYSRIMHAGDVQKDDFTPPHAPSWRIRERHVHRWADRRSVEELVDLAQTRSYVATAPPRQRERVRENLRWYLLDHLGHAPGASVALPYRTDLFVLVPEGA